MANFIALIMDLGWDTGHFPQLHVFYTGYTGRQEPLYRLALIPLYAAPPP
jgi:hypothetical protein